MGLRGPKPKHPALKAMGLRAVDGAQPGRLRRGLPTCPPELAGEAAIEWASVSAALHDAGTLSVCDRGILAAYCLAVQDLLAARAEIERAGRWQESPQTTSKGDVVGVKIKEHPAVKMVERASARIQRLGAALGLSPESRARQEAATPPALPKGNAVVAIREQVASLRAGQGRC